MKDSILKGTGNSRFLKSAVPAGTSWSDALAMLQAGTFPIDFNGINTEGFQQLGTPLNKANLLKDATTQTLGLPSSATPNDMFNVLAHAGDLHVWKKAITSGTGTYSLDAVQEGLHYIKWANNSATSDSSGTFEYGSEIAVNNDGTITGIKNPSTITIKPWDDDASKANVFKGKFIKMISQVRASMSSFDIGEIWWIPADVVMTKGLLNGEGNRWYIAASKRQQVIGVPAGTTATYPVSTNRNAYQEGNDAKPAGYTLGDVVEGVMLNLTTTAQGTKITYATSLIVSNDGKLSLGPDSTSITMYYSTGPSGVSNTINGRYVIISNESLDTAIPLDEIIYIPKNATISLAGDGTNYKISAYQPVTGYPAVPANTTIEYLGCLGDKARVQAVSYVGTGTYGSSNSNSLTFDFVPKVVIVASSEDSNSGNAPHPKYGWYHMFLWIHGMNGTIVYSSAVSFINDGKKLSWYSNDFTAQCNVSGTKYYAVALC